MKEIKSVLWRAKVEGKARIVSECAMTHPEFTCFTQGPTSVKVYLNGYYIVARSQTQEHRVGVCVQ